MVGTGCLRIIRQHCVQEKGRVLLQVIRFRAITGIIGKGGLLNLGLPVNMIKIIILWNISVRGVGSHFNVGIGKVRRFFLLIPKERLSLVLDLKTEEVTEEDLIRGLSSAIKQLMGTEEKSTRDRLGVSYLVC